MSRARRPNLGGQQKRQKVDYTVFKQYRHGLDKTLANYISQDGKEIGDSHDGIVLYSDYYEFSEVVDLFASEYGLGGCRSLTEFAQMIDNEDPLLVDTLMMCIAERHRRRNDPDYKPEEYQSLEGEYRGAVSGFQRGARQDDSLEGMARFLMNNGASQKEVKEVLRKIKEGEINVKQYDFSWVDPISLQQPKPPEESGFKDWPEVFAALKEQRETSINFNLKLEDFGRKKR